MPHSISASAHSSMLWPAASWPSYGRCSAICRCKATVRADCCFTADDQAEARLKWETTQAATATSTAGLQVCRRNFTAE